MSNIDIVDRNKILQQEIIEFDKVLRGYDPKQVDEYITNLRNSQKNASEMFDSRYNDLRNENEMLKYELEQKSDKLNSLEIRYKKLEEERQRLIKKSEEAPKEIKVVDNSALEELQEKYDKLVVKNRMLSDDNRKLTKTNSDLQRDVAHLTKKVDKNRSEINSLRTDVEVGITDDTVKKNAEVARIYKDAIDKAEELIFRMQTELSLAHSKAEDVTDK